MPDKIKKQNTSSTCVAASISAISKILGQNIKQNTIIRTSRKTLNIVGMRYKGVTINDLGKMVNHFFETSSNNNIQGIINNGEIGISAYITGYERVGNKTIAISHAVIVTGYTANGNAVILDPLTGSQRIINSSHLLKQQTYGISGIK